MCPGCMAKQRVVLQVKTLKFILKQRLLLVLFGLYSIVVQVATKESTDDGDNCVANALTRHLAKFNNISEHRQH